LRVQQTRNAHIDAHVVKKPHLEILAKVNLFLGQPGGVLNRLLDVFLFQIRVALKNFLKRRAVGDLTYNYGNRYAHTAYACSPAHDLGVEGDSVEHTRVLLAWVRIEGCSPSFRIQRLPYDSQALKIFAVTVFIRSENMYDFANSQKGTTSGGPADRPAS
jgi:hypothetical protein